MVFKLIILGSILTQGNSLVSLFTAQHCRQCHKFNRVFSDIVETNPQLDYNVTTIDQETFSYAKSMDIRKVPTVVFDDGTRLTGIPENYDAIKEKCKSMSYPNIPDSHVHSSILCRDIYDDDVLYNSEKYVENKETDVQIMFCVYEETLYIASRGSDHRVDWRHNFQFAMNEYPYGSKKMFHSGFLVQWFSVREEFMNAFNEMIGKHTEINKVVLSGHSAGSSMATLAALEIEKFIDIDIEVVTFGSPRMSNVEFKNDFSSKVNCTRYINDNDIVTKVPLKLWGYRHLGEPSLLKNNGEIVKKDLDVFQTFLAFVQGLLVAEIGIRDHDISRYVEKINKSNECK